eukprot:jgi/Mesvir1/16514/Mv10064-RA.1
MSQKIARVSACFRLVHSLLAKNACQELWLQAMNRTPVCLLLSTKLRTHVLNRHRALWATEPPLHAVTAMVCVPHPPSIWTGDDEGRLFRWAVSSPENVQVKPISMQCGHAGAITALEVCCPDPATAPWGRDDPQSACRHPVDASEYEEGLGAWVVSVGLDCVLCVWDASTGKCRRRMELPATFGPPLSLGGFPGSPRVVAVGLGARGLPSADAGGPHVEPVLSYPIGEGGLASGGGLGGGAAGSSSVLLVDTATASVVCGLEGGHGRLVAGGGGGAGAQRLAAHGHGGGNETSCTPHVFPSLSCIVAINIIYKYNKCPLRVYGYSHKSRLKPATPADSRSSHPATPSHKSRSDSTIPASPKHHNPTGPTMIEATAIKWAQPIAGSASAPDLQGRARHWVVAVSADGSIKIWAGVPSTLLDVTDLDSTAYRTPYISEGSNASGRAGACRVPAVASSSAVAKIKAPARCLSAPNLSNAEGEVEQEGKRKGGPLGGGCRPCARLRMADLSRLAGGSKVREGETGAVEGISRNASGEWQPMASDAGDSSVRSHEDGGSLDTDGIGGMGPDAGGDGGKDASSKDGSIPRVLGGHSGEGARVGGHEGLFGAPEGGHPACPMVATDLSTDGRVVLTLCVHQWQLQASANGRVLTTLCVGDPYDSPDASDHHETGSLHSHHFSHRVAQPQGTALLAGGRFLSIPEAHVMCGDGATDHAGHTPPPRRPHAVLLWFTDGSAQVYDVSDLVALAGGLSACVHGGRLQADGSVDPGNRTPGAGSAHPGGPQTGLPGPLSAPENEPSAEDSESSTLSTVSSTVYSAVGNTSRLSAQEIAAGVQPCVVARVGPDPRVSLGLGPATGALWGAVSWAAEGLSVPVGAGLRGSAPGNAGGSRMGSYGGSSGVGENGAGENGSVGDDRGNGSQDASAVVAASGWQDPGARASGDANKSSGGTQAYLIRVHTGITMDELMGGDGSEAHASGSGDEHGGSHAGFAIVARGLSQHHEIISPYERPESYVSVFQVRGELGVDSQPSQRQPGGDLGAGASTSLVARARLSDGWRVEKAWELASGTRATTGGLEASDSHGGDMRGGRGSEDGAKSWKSSVERSVGGHVTHCAGGVGASHPSQGVHGPCGPGGRQVSCVLFVNGDLFVASSLVVGYVDGGMEHKQADKEASSDSGGRHGAGEGRGSWEGKAGVPGERRLQTLVAHTSTVLCMVEHCLASSRVAGGHTVVVSGGADWKICVWVLDGRPVAQPVAILRHHAGPVSQLILPPLGAPNPWCSCVVAISGDASVSVVSLETMRAERIFPGHVSPPSVCAWDTSRGFLACLCARSEGAVPDVVYVWDLLSGSIERVTRGPRARLFFRQLHKACADAVAALSSRMGSHGGIPTPSGSSNTSALISSAMGVAGGVVGGGTRGLLYRHDATGNSSVVKFSGNAEAEYHYAGIWHGAADASHSASATGNAASWLAPMRPIRGTCPSPGIAVLEIDLQTLLTPEAVGISSSVFGGSTTSGMGSTAGLHTGATSTPSPNKSISSTGSHSSAGAMPGISSADPLSAHVGGAVGAAGDAAAAAAAAGGDPGHGQGGHSTPQGKVARDGLPSAEGRALRMALGQLHVWGLDASLDKVLVEELEVVRPRPGSIGGGVYGDGGGLTLMLPYAQQRNVLWSLSHEFCALQLLAIVSLSERLMLLSERATNACSKLVTLYAVRLLREMPGALQPSFEVFACFWQHPCQTLRMSARSLFHAAATHALPAPLLPKGAHAKRRGASAQTPRAASQDAKPEGEEAATTPRKLLRDKSDLTEMDAEMFMSWLEPCEGATWPGAVADGLEGGCRVIVAGLGAVAHPRQVARGVAECVAPLLLRLVQAITGRHSAAAAEVLAEGMECTWAPLMGDMAQLMQDTFALAERLTSRIDPTREMVIRESLSELMVASAAADFRSFYRVMRERVASVPPDSPTHVMALMTVIRIIHSRPPILLPYLLPVVDLVLQILDPAAGLLRKTCLQTGTALLHQMVLRFPMVALHKATMRLVVGEATARGPLTVYDMQTTEKARVLLQDCACHGSSGGTGGGGGGGPAGVGGKGGAQGEPAGCAGQVSAVAFSPDGSALAAFSEVGFVDLIDSVFLVCRV